MDKKQQWVVMTAVAVVGVFAAGWFLLVAPKHAQASDVRAQVAAAQTTTAGLRTQLATLKALAKNLPAEQAKVAAVEARIPSDPQLPALIRALTSAAATSGVELVSLVPGQPVPVTATAPAGSTASSGTTTATSTASKSGASTTSTTGLNSVGLTMTVFGNYSETEQFLAALEDLPRATRVSAVSVVPGDDPTVKRPDGAAPPVNNGSSLSTTIIGQVFLAPAATAVVPGPVTAVGGTTAGLAN